MAGFKDFKDCHQRLPKVLLKWWLSSKTVIKHCSKFCWSDGCLSRLSAKTAESSAEVMAVFKDCHETTLPKVLLKWWLSLKTVMKQHCSKFCWSDGCPWRLSSNTAQSSAEVHDGCLSRLSLNTARRSAEVMAVFKDCHQTLPKVLLKCMMAVFQDCL